MSLTLRDAQFLSWKTFKKIEAKVGGNSDFSSFPVLIAKKAGEILEKTKASSSVNPDKEELSKTLSELLYLAFVFAEKNGVSLEETFMQTMDDYIVGLVS